MTFTQLLFSLAIAFVTAAGAYGAARFAGKSSVKAKEIDVRATAYVDAQLISKETITWLRDQIIEMKKGQADLKAELAEVKVKTEDVMQDLEIAVNWFEQFLGWEREGSNPPRPHIPAALRKHINRARLIEQRQEQIEHNREDDHA